MDAVRCKRCDKLLCRWDGIGRVEIKCPRCRFINNLERPERHRDNESSYGGAHAQKQGFS
ncbi:MAG: hypothetical protein CMI09_05800 [Oceanospirillaceae bacterium]|nr:hypothetical protein [Oceanospirillaceae bacterium]